MLVYSNILLYHIIEIPQKTHRFLLKTVTNSFHTAQWGALFYGLSEILTVLKERHSGKEQNIHTCF